MTEQISIRDIQHYLYCPRRFGLLRINDDWQENSAVIKANLLHSKVHGKEHGFTSQKGKSESSVWLYNDALGIYGVADCIEYEKNPSAPFSPALGGNYTVRVVEYKPTKPKSGEISEPDAVQVFAQKICADSIFGISCEGFLYYGDVKRRIRLPFDSEYDRYYSLLKKLLEEMKAVVNSGEVPQRTVCQKCNGCSMKQVCMPKSSKYSVRNEIEKLLKETEGKPNEEAP